MTDPSMTKTLEPKKQKGDPKFKLNSKKDQSSTLKP